MKRAEIHRFLRFTTESSVLLASNISVPFNSLSGLVRRPIAHTCSSTLELSSIYINYLDFENEFKASSLGKCMQFKNLFSWFLRIHQYSRYYLTFYNFHNFKFSCSHIFFCPHDFSGLMIFLPSLIVLSSFFTKRHCQFI